MLELEERLSVWEDAGLLAHDQVEAIARYEAEHPTGPGDVHAGLLAGVPAERRVLPAEAIGYVGAALAISALMRLVAELWVDLVVGGQLALVGLLAVIALTGGILLNRTTSAPLQRLTSVLLTAGVGATAWFTFILTGDVLDLTERWVPVLTALVAVAVAVPFYRWRPRALPQATALGAIVALFATVGNLPTITPDPWVFGVGIWTIGLVWLLLSLGGYLMPTLVSGVLGGGLALVGAQIASIEDARAVLLLIGIATAGALIGLALQRDEFHHLVIGAAGLFVFVPQLVFELFGETIGAPAALLVIGLLLIALAVMLGRAGREIRRPRRSRTPSA
jgi:hypothetical protein